MLIIGTLHYFTVYRCLSKIGIMRVQFLLTEHCAGVETTGIIPYSRKYWRELNLAVEPKIAIARILADLKLAVRYGNAIHILYASRKFWRIFIWRL